jgi:hypothetical protein
VGFSGGQKALAIGGLPDYKYRRYRK